MRVSRLPITVSPGWGCWPASVWAELGGGAVVDKVLTYNREVGWAAAQAVVKSQGSHKAPSGSLAVARSSARKAAGRL